MIVSTHLPGRYNEIVLTALQCLQNDFVVGDNIYDLIYLNKPKYVWCDIDKLSADLCQWIIKNNAELIIFGNGCPEFASPALVCVDHNARESVYNNIADPILTIGNFANTTSIWGGEQKDYFKCDIGILLSEPPPLQDIEYIHSLINHVTNFKIKIVGTKIHLPQYLGQIERHNLSSFFNSCNVVNNFNGPHTIDIIAHGKSYVPNAKQLRYVILTNHTSYHMLWNILEKIDYLDGYDKCIKNHMQRIASSAEL